MLEPEFVHLHLESAMPTPIEKLTRRIATIVDSPSIDPELWNGWLSQPSILTPWQSWTLLVLVRHRTRQELVADIARFRLKADLARIAESGALGHPDIPVKGVVPGLTDLEYLFHGCGCAVTHRISGEMIDVDFYDATADWINPSFFIEYMRSLKSLGFAERRAIDLHASINTFYQSLDELFDLNLLQSMEDDTPYCLAFPSLDLGEQLTVLEARWEQADVRLAVAAAVGDWFFLQEHAPSDLLPQIRSKAEECRRSREEKLVTQYGVHADGLALMCLNDLHSPVLPDLVHKALHDESFKTIDAALDIVDGWDNADWCDDLQLVLDRSDPDAEIRHASRWFVCARFLIRHGRLESVRKLLPKNESLYLGDLAILTLEYLPDLAIDTFRRALRSVIPANRITAAAALAIIDQPWSRAELVSTLSESGDAEQTCECRSALMATHSSECHQIVANWEATHPSPKGLGPYVSLREIAVRQGDETISFEMAELHDRVHRLKNVQV